MKLLCVLGLLSLYFALILAQSEAPGNATEPVTSADTNTTMTIAPETNNTSTAEPHKATTTAGQHTTAAPEPAPTAEGTLYILTKDNVNCVLLNVRMHLNITYMKKDGKNATSSLELPSNTTTNIDGSCDSKEQDMILSFTPPKGSKDVSITMNFMQNSQNEQYVGDIIIDYDLSDEKIFPNSSLTVPQQANVSGEFFKVSESNQYLCKSNSSQDVSDFVKMITSELRLQAFRTGNGTDFTGDSQQCPADAETNNIVPIAVGAALAALVVIVLIAYLISRNRNKGGYESV